MEDVLHLFDPPQNGHPAADGNAPLNVGDPRYSARYGNPYLRTLAATAAPDNNTTTFASMNSHVGGNRGYSTLNPAARHKGGT